MRKWVMCSISKKWRDFKCELKKEFYKPHLTMEERLENRDSRVTLEHWKFLNDFWDTEESKARCTKNKNSRKKVRMGHTAGTRTFSCVEYEIEKKKAAPVNQIELFIEVHKKKDGEPVNEKAKEMLSQLDEALQQIDGSENAATIENIYCNIIGKKTVSNKSNAFTFPMDGKDSDEEKLPRKELESKLEIQQKAIDCQQKELALLKLKQKNLELLILERSKGSLVHNVDMMHEIQNDEGASLEPLTRTLQNKEKNNVRSSTIEKKDVFLMSLDDPHLKVASGQICVMDPYTTIGGTALGLNFIGVCIEVALQEEEPLIRPFNQYQKIGDVRGTIVAWPKKLVIQRG